MAETLAEYNGFVQSENAVTTASVLDRDDVTWLASTHPELAQAVGGVSRLHSIGRFLKSKIGDPNFQKTALNIFGAALGTAVPQLAPFLPVINSFINQINPSGSAATTPPAATGTANNAITVPVDSTGALRIILVDERSTAKTSTPSDTSTATPKPPKPAPATPPDVPTLLKMIGAEIDATTGISTVKKPDGTTVKFDKNGIPIP